jgi:hypothetical protein
MGPTANSEDAGKVEAGEIDKVLRVEIRGIKGNPVPTEG